MLSKYPMCHMPCVELGEFVTDLAGASRSRQCPLLVRAGLSAFGANPLPHHFFLAQELRGCLISWGFDLQISETGAVSNGLLSQHGFKIHHSSLEPGA